MEYPPAVKKLLDAAGAREGDTVEVTGEGWSHTGVVMPHHGLSGEDVLPEVAMLKLMHVLGHAKEMEEIARLMRLDIAGGINPAISLQEFEDD